jgi:GNAT superfamily N-acetyltransferase
MKPGATELTAKLGPEERETTARLLASEFKNDQGICALWGDKDQEVDEDELKIWFGALLALLDAPGSVVIAKTFDEVSGVIVRTIKAKPASTQKYFSWLWKILTTLGLGVVVATARHDRARSSHIPRDASHLVEFVCVSPKRRGFGIAKMLLNETPRTETTSMVQWLETTKIKNVEIFKRCGFSESSRYQDKGVLNICMTKS